jgi:hypothetical protein
MIPDGRASPRHQTELAFDSFLDALSEDAPQREGPQCPDPAAVMTARAIHALAEAEEESTPPPGTLEMIWEDLMQQQLVTSSRMESPPRSTRARTAAVDRRGRRSLQRTLPRVTRFPFGEVAIAAVIILLLSTTFAVYRESRTPPPEEPSRLPAAGAAATPTLLPIVPDPAGCAIEPRTMGELGQLMPTSGASDRGQDDMTPVPQRTSSAANETTVVGVTDTVRELYACVSNNDHLRAYALFTDDALRRWFAQHGLLTPEEIVEGFGARDAFRVLEVYHLEDGRVGATIQFQVSEGKFRETWIFTRADDRYLVDEIVRPEPGATPAVATPASSGATPER